MSAFRNKRMREGALSALRTPDNPPAQPRLVPVEGHPGAGKRPIRLATSDSFESRLVEDAVAHAKQGDPEGLHFLYLRFAPDVQRYVNSVVHDHHEAEEITQSVFAKLVSAIGKYEPGEVPFSAWILRVARNAALNHMRAAEHIPSGKVKAQKAPREEGQGRSAALREALKALPDDQREVLVLRHIVGLSPTEIALALEKSQSSVHGLHQRGLRALRDDSLLEEEPSPVTVPPSPFAS